jgi:hypothetical protein
MSPSCSIGFIPESRIGTDLTSAGIGWQGTSPRENYELIGPLIGPSSATISTESGTFEVEDLYSGRIGFVYRGASFEDHAQFAMQDGSIYWLGICR